MPDETTKLAKQILETPDDYFLTLMWVNNGYPEPEFGDPMPQMKEMAKVYLEREKLLKLCRIMHFDILELCGIPYQEAVGLFGIKETPENSK